MSGETNQDYRVAVVTGGAGGIGSAIVARLAPEHTVVVLDRTGDVVVDLSDTDDVRRAAELVLERYGRRDVLVHAAATFAFGPLEQVELDTWRKIQAVNVELAPLLTQAFVPGMQERGFGRVIFIVSNTFWSPPDGQMLPYVASKGALIGMTRTLAVGLGGDGTAVTAVAPGLTHTRPAPPGRRPSSRIPRRTWRCIDRSHPTTPPRSRACSPATKPKPSPVRR